jgi:hypothetical protein
MTLKEVQGFLEGHSWTFAKTMPESPHWYIHKRDTYDINTFIEVVRFIQQDGLPSIYEGSTYIYLVLDNYKYWTMGSLPEETTIINRTDVRNV